MNQLSGDITHNIGLSYDIKKFFEIKQEILKVKTIKKEMEDEKKYQLSFAKSVQKSVLNKPEKKIYIDLSGYFLPSEDLSGDMYAFYEISANRYGAIVIDVMGHGIASALISMSIRSLLRGLITRVVEPLHVIEELKQHLKNLLVEQVCDISFQFSVMYVVIDTEKQTIEYVNAGHPPAILIQANKSNSDLLDIGGMAVGSPLEISFQKGKITYETPANLLLYSDGILDTLAPNIIDSMNQLEKLVRNCANASSENMIANIKKKLMGIQQFPDDICFVAIHLPKTNES